MTPEDHRPAWGLLFRQWNQRRHLRVVNNDNICAPLFGMDKRAAGTKPVPIGVLLNPTGDLFPIFLTQALLRRRDSLEYIMVRLGDAKNARSWLRHIPFHVCPKSVREPHHGVSHERNTSALRGGAEESDFDLPLLEIVGIMLDSLPGVGRHRILVVLLISQLHVEASINLNKARKTDLQQGDTLRAKQSILGQYMITPSQYSTRTARISEP